MTSSPSLPNNPLLPANWDTSTLMVSPSEVNSIYQSVNSSATDINNYLNDIIELLSGLRLSWTGTSASLADDFATRWTNAMTALWGTKADPDAGIAQVLLGALSVVASNYGENEQALTGMWNQFGSGGSSNTWNSTDITDQVTNGYYHTTSVDETFFPVPNG
jgi:uncharacterized protein YukE